MCVCVLRARCACLFRQHWHSFIRWNAFSELNVLVIHGGGGIRKPFLGTHLRCNPEGDRERARPRESVRVLRSGALIFKSQCGPGTMKDVSSQLDGLILSARHNIACALLIWCQKKCTKCEPLCIYQSTIQGSPHQRVRVCVSTTDPRTVITNMLFQGQNVDNDKI